MKPVVFGAAMGLMLIWMIHGQMTSESTTTGWALAAFVGAHFLVGLFAIAAGAGLMRLSPRLQPIVDRLHRPSLKHFSLMIVGVLASFASVHFYMHGGIA